MNLGWPHFEVHSWIQEEAHSAPEGLPQVGPAGNSRRGCPRKHMWGLQPAGDAPTLKQDGGLTGVRGTDRDAGEP